MNELIGDNMLETVHEDRNNLLRNLHKTTIKNFMDILVLSELRKSTMSGYDVITLIYQKFDFLPSSGSVYSLLYALERRGLIKGGWCERKRIYTLTPKGEEFVDSALTLHGRVEDLMTKIFAEDLSLTA